MGINELHFLRLRIKLTGSAQGLEWAGKIVAFSSIG